MVGWAAAAARLGDLTRPGRLSSTLAPPTPSPRPPLQVLLWLAVAVFIASVATASAVLVTAGLNNNGGGSSSSGSPTSDSGASTTASGEPPAAPAPAPAPAQGAAGPLWNASAPTFFIPQGYYPTFWDEFDGAQLDMNRWAYDTAAATDRAESEGVQVGRGRVAGQVRWPARHHSTACVYTPYSSWCTHRSIPPTTPPPCVCKTASCTSPPSSRPTASPTLRAASTACPAGIPA